MVKAKKREPLVVGQLVYLETISYFFKEKRRISEYEVVEANRNSAYVVRMDSLDEFKADPVKNKWSKMRIEQKTHDVKSSGMAGYAYCFWLTEETFNKSVELQKEKAKLQQQAQEKVKEMTLQQLREFMGCSNAHMYTMQPPAKECKKCRVGLRPDLS